MIENCKADQLEQILETLPVDISFVDENDLVRYWNRHETRVFKRPMSVVGRPVQSCHPRQSIEIVNKILEEFKAGTKDAAEFWLDLGGRKVYIRYFAVRNKEGNYLGTLEVGQDITDIQKLEGERRILDWGKESE
jgi:PAS domain S-box-containing protein